MNWDSSTAVKRSCMPGAGDKIKRIAEVLMQYGLDMRVEGHTDDVPIHNAQFASNWDLSTARAMAVAMMLLNESGVRSQPDVRSQATRSIIRPPATILRRAAELTGGWIL